MRGGKGFRQTPQCKGRKGGSAGPARNRLAHTGGSGEPTGLPPRSAPYCALLAAATWAATSAAKSSCFFSMPSPTTYRVKPLAVVPVDFK